MQAYTNISRQPIASMFSGIIHTEVEERMSGWVRNNTIKRSELHTVVSCSSLLPYNCVIGFFPALRPFRKVGFSFSSFLSNDRAMTGKKKKYHYRLSSIVIFFLQDEYFCIACSLRQDLTLASYDKCWRHTHTYRTPYSMHIKEKAKFLHTIRKHTYNFILYYSAARVYYTVRIILYSVRNCERKIT